MQVRPRDEAGDCHDKGIAMKRNTGLGYGVPNGYDTVNFEVPSQWKHDETGEVVTVIAATAFIRFTRKHKPMMEMVPWAFLERYSPCI